MSDIWTRNTIIGQSEYSFDTRWDDASLVAPIIKITKVAIKYKSDADYVLVLPLHLWDAARWLDNDTGKSLSSNVSLQWYVDKHIP